MSKRDRLYDLPPDPEVLRRVARRLKRRPDDGGEAVPADRGPRPLPLAGGAEAPLD